MILQMQYLFPAFFIKPRHAETESPVEKGLSYASRQIYYAPNNLPSNASLRAKYHSETKATTLEPRLCDHAPYFPVYLYLRILEKSLRGEVIECDYLPSDTQKIKALGWECSLSDVFKGRGAFELGENEAGDEIPNLLKGSDGYKKCLEITAMNLEHFSHVIPCDLGQKMLEHAREQYAAYQSLPPIPDYTKKWRTPKTPNLTRLPKLHIV